MKTVRKTMRIDLIGVSDQPCSGVEDDPLSVIEQEAKAAAIAFGVPVPDDLARSIAHRVQHRLAGDRPYFASPSSLKRAETSEWLSRNFKGNNYAELAKAVGKSERQVRRILSARSLPKK